MFITEFSTFSFSTDNMDGSHVTMVGDFVHTVTLCLLSNTFSVMQCRID